MGEKKEDIEKVPEGDMVHILELLRLTEGCEFNFLAGLNADYD